jgi:hypothetical protein
VRFCLAWYLVLPNLLHFFCLCLVFYVLCFVVIRLPSCEASLLYCCCYCWFTQINLKLSLYFFIAFWTTWTTWWFSWLKAKVTTRTRICMFLFWQMLTSCSYICWCKSSLVGNPFNTSFFPFVIVSTTCVLMRVLVREIVYHSASFRLFTASGKLILIIFYYSRKVLIV